MITKKAVILCDCLSELVTMVPEIHIHYLYFGKEKK
eukprot:UN16946